MATATFANTTAIEIADRSTASQTLAVTGLYGTISGISITLTGLTHTSPVDLDFLLVAPDGTGFVFMGAAGYLFDVVDVNLTFSDNGSGLLPEDAQIVSGTFLPTSHLHANNFPGHTGPVIFPGLGETFATTFGGNPNGAWKLYVADVVREEVGSLDGWSLEITYSGGMQLNDLASSAVFEENTVNDTPQLIDADVTLAGSSNQFDDGTLVVSGLLAEDVVSGLGCSEGRAVHPSQAGADREAHHHRSTGHQHGGGHQGGAQRHHGRRRLRADCAGRG